MTQLIDKTYITGLQKCYCPHSWWLSCVWLFRGYFCLTFSRAMPTIFGHKLAGIFSSIWMDCSSLWTCQSKRMDGCVFNTYFWTYIFFHVNITWNETACQNHWHCQQTLQFHKALQLPVAPCIELYDLHTVFFVPTSVQSQLIQL